MDGRTLRLAIGIAGTAVALAGESVALESGGSPEAVLLNLAIGLAYLYGGLAIWDRAPANRTGAKMTAVGLTWFIGSVAGSGIPVLGEAGQALGDLYSVFLLTLVLSYPGGILETTVNRVGIAVMLVGTTALNTLNLVRVPLVVNEGINGLYVGLSLAVMASVLVVRRWVLAPARTRDELRPVLLAGAVFIVTIAINIIRRIALVPDSTAELLIAAAALAPAAIPVSLLIGFYRQSDRRLQALVDAIPDPLFRIGRDGQVLDGAEPGDRAAEGRPQLPADRGLAVILLETEGDAILAAATDALDQGTIQSLDVGLDLPDGRRELEVRLAPSGPDEVTAIVRDFTDQRRAEAEILRSRARIVEAADAERRRVERNLHDGAQQRLVALSLGLRRARAQLDPDPDGAAATLEEASVQLKAALVELRELARGIHPAILTEAGLGPAVRALAAESAVPVTLDLDLPAGLSSHVEAAAYYVVAESLTNCAKYADARRIEITGSAERDELRIAVRDDGRGGADPAAGSGLRGLADRVAALGGQLDVHSAPGRGTLVAARLPIEPVPAPA